MYQQTDGGREDAGFKGKTDCGIRAVSVATLIGYKAAQDLLKRYNKALRGNKAIAKGIHKDVMDAALRSLGWEWFPAPKFEGRKARYSDIPGTAVLRMAKHYAVVHQGILLDDWDSSEKMVYGYWRKQ